MGKRTPLVCQHLENISREALEKYQDIIRLYVRRRQGVYALYRHNKLYYVGLASNLRSRLAHHLRDRHQDSWDRFSVYLTIGDRHLKELESLILRIVKPAGNKQKGTFIKSEDIRRKFSRDIRMSQRDELISLLGRKISRKEEEEEKFVKDKKPVLSKYFTAPVKLRARYKGHIIRAHVKRNGQISFRGKVYSSPSLAGAVACKRGSCNGWTFWQYERAPGDWVPLNELRK
jgi:predicted GIY-YIG superfamily endonuclease